MFIYGLSKCLSKIVGSLVGRHKKNGNQKISLKIHQVRWKCKN